MSETARIISHATVLAVVLAAACNQGSEAVTPATPVTTIAPTTTSTPATPSSAVAPIAPSSTVAAIAPSSTVAPATSDAGARPGTCAPSSVAKNAVCPKHVVAPGNGSSPEGCKSDADCAGTGRDARCVKNVGGRRSSIDPATRRSNFLAGPPPPPRRSICVADQCASDADCGPKARCECRTGVGSDRNSCTPTDECLSDRDCRADTLCVCGQVGLANGCSPGNCRSDADCKGFACIGAEYGPGYCRTARDTCKTNEDCKGDPNGGYSRCDFDLAKRAWGCRIVPPIPPG